jgi:hypothetical protein
VASANHLRRPFPVHSPSIDFGPAAPFSMENHQKPLYFDGFLWKTIKNHRITKHIGQGFLVAPRVRDIYGIT